MDSDRATRLFRRSLLLVLFLVLVSRLIGFVVRFGNESLQMDLAAYYTAGQSAQAGESPYLNHVERDPPIWDGVNVFRHSRFLYPPLAAETFRLLTTLPYFPVKFLWMALSLAALSVTMVLAVRLARMRATLDRWLILGIGVCAFYPVLALLERGQLDAFTLLAIAIAWRLMQAERPGASLGAGMLFALASLAKLNCAFLLPFLLLRRRWKVISGFAIGAVALLGLDLAVNGRSQLQEYWLEEFSRIARHGEGGTRAMSLPGSAFAPLLRGVEPGRTVIDGRTYRPNYFQFVLNASLVQAAPGNLLRSLARAADRPVPRLSHLALFFLVLFCVLFVVWQRRAGPPPDELVYWQSVLIVILLCGPVSWSMNTVWLLPMVPIVLREFLRLDGTRHALALLACVLGLLLVGVPDPYGNFMLSPFGQRVLDGKYVVGQSLCLAGLLGLWSKAATQRTLRGSTPVNRRASATPT